MNPTFLTSFQVMLHDAVERGVIGIRAVILQSSPNNDKPDLALALRLSLK